ncbi:MAG: thioesterase family protein [Bacteroidota bacterium]
MPRVTLDMYPIQAEYPVHWGDMDAAQHVNNLVYLLWSETARLVYFENLGIDISFSSEVGPILGWQECKYMFPMTYPDTAMVGIRTIDLQNDRFTIECGMFSKKHNRIAALSKHLIIPYDYQNLKKTELPQSWKENIEAEGV